MSMRSGRVRVNASETSPSRSRRGVSPQRSPARKKASSPARSPSRKSPARKSPSRKTSSKFPARKSPSRTTKEVTEKIESPPIITSPAKRTSIRINAERNNEEKPNILDTLRIRRSQRSEYSLQDVSVELAPVKIDVIDKLNGLESSIFSSESKIVKMTKYSTDMIPKRSSVLREVDDTDPKIRKSISKSVSKSIETLSDTEHSEEEFMKEKSKSVTRKLITPLRENLQKLTPLVGTSEFGGRFGHFLLMFSIPLTVFAILILCSTDCSVKQIDLLILKNVWYESSAWMFLIAQVILQTILAAFPIFGKRAHLFDESKRTYCFNALFSSSVVLTLLFGLQHFKVIPSDAILNNIIPLAFVSYIFSVLFSFALYVKSYKLEKSYLNPYGNTGNILNDFFIGREINPNHKKLYFKILISRICNINALVLAILLFQHGIGISGPLKIDTDMNTYKDMWSRLWYQPTILTFSMMQIMYLLNFIIKEYQIVTTFYWQQEGLGYLQIVSSGLYPFYFTAISKSIVDGKVSLPFSILIGAIILYVTGFAIMLASNTIKYKIRKNPSMIYMETMPTFHGKRILLSSLWGIVRHPNYTGDIMIHAALALPGLLSGRWVASVPALLTIVVLIHRAWRDHIRCQRKYGSAWQRYCKRVPSVIIPKIL